MLLRYVTLTFALSMILGAQIRSSRITGSVVDPGGAAIPEARVEVIETRTNISYVVATNEAGEFTVPYLPPGLYQVAVSKTGFSQYLEKGFELGTGQQTRIEVRLKVQSVEGKIEVFADAVNVQTENATLQGVTGEKVIQNVPNVNHNPLYYVSLQMGVTTRASASVSTGQNSFGIGINGRRALSAIGVNGGGAFQNDFQVDGVSVIGSAWNEAAVLPGTEGLQEVRTTVNNYSAEYGRGQGVISMTTKSGGNDIHGSAFWRHRNEAFNANSFGNNARGIARQPSKVHTYGGTVGGPIVKNKAFFFTSWEGLRFNEGLVFLRTVPTVLEKQGNFSQTLANVSGRGVPLQLFDPFNVTQTGNNVYARNPLPNSIIPASRLNRAALGQVQNYPDPNRTPDDVFNTNNFTRSGVRTYRRNLLNSRVDYRLNDKNSLYFTGGFTYGDVNSPLTWGENNLYNSATGEQFAPFVSDRNPYLSAGDTWVISPTLVLDIRYGLNRVKTGSLANDTPDFDYTAAGIPANIQAAMAVRRVPNFFNSNYWSVLNNNAYMHKDERQTNHVLAGSVTKTKGKWTLKFGGETRQNFSNYTDAQESISYTLVAGATAGPSVNATGGLIAPVNNDQNGHAYASFLLGAGNLTIGRGFNVKPAFLQQYYALYTQNDWRPTNRLTLNFGVRWDYQPGITDRYNRITSFDPNGTNPYGGKGAWYFPGSTGEDRNLWQADKKNFGPRVGAAYKLKENLVLRGGVGVIYLPSNTGFFNGPYNYGMQSFAPFTDPNLYGVNPAGFIVGDFAQVTRLVEGSGDDARNPGLYGGSPNPRFPRTGYVTPRVTQANFFVEWKKGDWLIATGWSGAYGRRLALSSLAANANDQYIPEATRQTWRTNYISRNGTGHLGTDVVTNPFQPANAARIPFSGSLGNATIPLRETLFPYPYFGTLGVQRQEGFSDYNAFQVQVTRSLKKGLLVSGNYTWSRALEVANAEAQNNFNAEGFGTQTGNLIDLRQNRRLSANDVPHRAVVTYLYELPIGRGKWIDPKNKIVGAVISGWQVSGVYTYQRGTPIVIGGANSNALNGRPDVNPGQDRVLPKNLQGWYDGRTPVTLPSGRVITPPAFSYLKYNPDAFVGRTVTVANGTTQRDVFWYGNAAFTYSDLRNESLNNWTMSIQRTIQITERFRLDIQGHAQNLFNHTQFSPNYTTGLGGTETLNNPSRGQLPGYGQAVGYGTRGLATYDPRNIEVVMKFRF